MSGDRVWENEQCWRCGARITQKAHRELARMGRGHWPCKCGAGNIIDGSEHIVGEVLWVTREEKEVAWVIVKLPKSEFFAVKCFLPDLLLANGDRAREQTNEWWKKREVTVEDNGKEASVFSFEPLKGSGEKKESEVSSEPQDTSK